MIRSYSYRHPSRNLRSDDFGTEDRFRVVY
jgi:hypothetical protein